MRATRAGRETALARCAGYAVETADGPAGRVETPLFPPDEATPDFLVLRVGGPSHPRRPVVPVTLVESIDPGAAVVRLRCRRGDVLRLPEHLPLAL